MDENDRKSDAEICRQKGLPDPESDAFRKVMHQIIEGGDSKRLKNAACSLTEAVEAMARQLRVSEAEIERLKEMSLSNPLTGLSNKVAFERDISNSIEEEKRNPDVVRVLVAVDMRGLKSINDEYGHVAGDLAIRAIAEFLNSETRPFEHPYHVSGDEFFVIARESRAKLKEEGRDAEGFRSSVLERFERLLSKGAEVEYEGKSLSVTGRVGSVILNTELDAQANITAADMEMNAKRSGDPESRDYVAQEQQKPKAGSGTQGLSSRFMASALGRTFTEILRWGRDSKPPPPGRGR